MKSNAQNCSITGAESNAPINVNPVGGGEECGQGVGI